MVMRRYVSFSMGKEWRGDVKQGTVSISGDNVKLRQGHVRLRRARAKQ